MNSHLDKKTMKKMVKVKGMNGANKMRKMRLGDVLHKRDLLKEVVGCTAGGAALRADD